MLNTQFYDSFDRGVDVLGAPARPSGEFIDRSAPRTQTIFCYLPEFMGYLLVSKLYIIVH